MSGERERDPLRHVRRGSRRIREEVDAEIAFHLAMRSAELERSGLSAEAAREEALRRFGELDRTRQACWQSDQRRERKMGRREYIREFVQDARYGLRGLVRNPLFAVLAAGTLALGIGANTTIFSVVDGLVLNPHPFPEPARLVGVGTVYPRLGGELGFWENLSPAEYVDIAEQSRTLERVVAWDMGNRQVTVGDQTENLFSGFWWGDAFPTLEMQPSLGRGFTEQEIGAGARVAILSDRVFRTRFGADRSLLGGQVLVNGDPYTLIGVMPPKALIYGMDMWIPMPIGPEVYARQRRQFQVLARLAPGATIETARADLDVIARRTEAEYGAEMEEYAGWRLVPMTWNDISTRALRPAALILLGAVGFVLLLVCANVASLMLGRTSSRRREIAVRAAIGAGRGRIARQLLTESVVLALVGGAIGVGLAVLGVRAIAGMLETLALPVAGDLVVDGRVLGFTAAVSIATGLLFGLAPAVQASRADVQSMLKSEGGGATAGQRRLRAQRVLVGVEVALALLLLAGGGLLVRSFVRLQSVDVGVNPENVLTMRLTLPWERYEGRVQPFFDALRSDIASIPGVVSVATALQIPPNGFSTSVFEVEDVAPPSEDAMPRALTTIASPGYFETLGIELIAGRSFDASLDRPGAPLRAVINEAAARQYFGGNAVGRRLRLGQEDPDRPWVEVVGVVASTRNRGLDTDPAPELFASSAQMGEEGGNQFFLLIRTRVEPRSVLPAVREAVRRLDPQQPVYFIRTLEEAFAGSVVQQRLSTTMLSIFAIFALILAAVGVYGVVAYAVTQRTREIGIRIALGADRGSVRALVLRQALLPVAIGGVFGLAGALAVSGLLESLLFEVEATDPVTLVLVCSLLVGVALLASWLPARRAMRLDPVVALRGNRT